MASHHITGTAARQVFALALQTTLSLSLAGYLQNFEAPQGLKNPRLWL